MTVIWTRIGACPVAELKRGTAVFRQAPSAASGTFRAPPALGADRMTVTVPLGDTTPISVDAAGRDVEILWPTSTTAPATTVDIQIANARNVVSIGGWWRPSGGGCSRQQALYLRDLRGTAHLERMRVELADRRWSTMALSGDFLQWRGPSGIHPSLVLQKCRVTGLRGDVAHPYHADLVQQAGPIGDVHVDGLTCSTNYQTFLWVPLTVAYTPTRKGKTFKLRNVNFIATGGRTDGRAADLFYLKSGYNYDPSLNHAWVFDIRFDGDSVYAAPLAGHTVLEHCTPNAGFPGSLGARAVAEGVEFAGISNSWDVGWADVPGVPFPTGGTGLHDRGGYDALGYADAFHTTLTAAGAARGKARSGHPPNGDFCKDNECGPGSPPLAYAR